MIKLAFYKSKFEKNPIEGYDRLENNKFFELNIKKHSIFAGPFILGTHGRTKDASDFWIFIELLEYKK